MEIILSPSFSTLRTAFCLPESEHFIVVACRPTCTRYVPPTLMGKDGDAITLLCCFFFWRGKKTLVRSGAAKQYRERSYKQNTMSRNYPDIYAELDDDEDVKAFYALQDKLHQNKEWREFLDAMSKPITSFPIPPMPSDPEMDPYDPESKLSNEERAAYPAIRAKAYVARDRICGHGACITGKSVGERIDVIQSMLGIAQGTIEPRIDKALKRHLYSIMDRYLESRKSSHWRTPQIQYDLREEERRFMATPKMKKLFADFERKKIRSLELARHETDLQLYSAMTTDEISDFI